MPSHQEHCQESLRRYGKTFSELHRWMDEPSEIMASKHRMYRHDPYTTPKEARALFGEYADQACLDHILADRRASEAKGLKVTHPHKQSGMHPIGLLFFAIMFFIFGAMMLPLASSRYGSSIGWVLIIFFWFFALLCFLGFLGSIQGITKEEETPIYHYEFETTTPEWKMLRPDEEKENESNASQNKNNS